MSLLLKIPVIISLIFFVCYSYQIIYIPISILKKSKPQRVDSAALLHLFDDMIVFHEKPRCGFLKELFFPGVHLFIAHLFIREGLRDRDLFFRKESFQDQIVRVDQSGIAGKSRTAVVGRISEPRGQNREHLPERLSCVSQKVDKAVRILSEISDPVAGGERGDMQENAAGPLLCGCVRL